MIISEPVQTAECPDRAAAARMDTDEVVGLADLRAYLERVVEAAWQTPRHVRNPRIWSLHDLSVLAVPGARKVVEKSVREEAKVEIGRAHV